jgi:hypothetical protein
MYNFRIVYDTVFHVIDSAIRILKPDHPTMSYRQSRILLPYLVPRNCFRPFFTLPNAFGGLGASSSNSGSSDDEMQNYHERKIMP